MTNKITLTSPQVAGQPIINGRRNLEANNSLSSFATTHTAIDVSQTDLIAVQVMKFGTLTGDCTLRLEASMDNGTNFRQVKAWTNAQIADANGIYESIQLHATHARFVLTPGTMTGANGVNTRMLT